MCSERKLEEIRGRGVNTSSEALTKLEETEEKIKNLAEEAEEKLRAMLF